MDTNQENSGNLKNCQKLGEICIFIEKTWKTRRICGIIADENVFQNYSLRNCSRKSFKIPGNLREESGNLVTQCGHPRANLPENPRKSQGYLLCETGF